jgi:hypothetical protein
MATDVDSTSLIEFNMIPTFISDELVPGLHVLRLFCACGDQLRHVPVKTPMTERGSKHSAQIKIDLFPQMRAGWRGSWGKMGGQAMKAGEIALAGPHTCYWGGS